MRLDGDAIRRTFQATGIVRLPGAFSGEDATRIRDAVWSYVERKSTVRAADPATWPETGLPVSFRNLKRNSCFESLMANPDLRAALDAVFHETGWRVPKPGAQVLFTLPGSSPWTMPSMWHMDCGFSRPTWPVFAVKLFAFAGAVGPEGGGTLLLSGSHRLVEPHAARLPADDRGGCKRTWHRFLRQDPWLAGLIDAGRSADGGRSRIGGKAEVGGVPLEVVELTGEPGDVVLTHLHVFHAGAPNATRAPRQMLGKLISANATNASDEGEPSE